MTFQTLLNDLTDVSSLPAYQKDTHCAQISSYDVTGGNDDGFSGKYSYLSRNSDSSLVIFDIKGPGVINRIWTPTPSEDSLSFYIDNDFRPAFTIRYLDLFTGKVFPFVPPLCGNQLGGFYCYLPLPFQKHCRIVYHGKKTQFHQIQYRQYPAGSPVKKFSLPLNVDETQALEKIKSLWLKESLSVSDFHPSEIVREAKQTIQLQAGQTQAVFKVEQGGRIVGMEFEPASAFQSLAKEIDIRITWDNEKTPAVLCPVADFFGYAFGRPSMKSLLLGTDGNRTYCYFPMPFDKSATIEFVFRKPEMGNTLPPVTIQSRILHTKQARNPATEGKFYSQWSTSNPTQPHQPHVLLRTTGRGHLVGTTLQAQGLKAGMTYFFEGDDSTSVDGQFRMHGTGSEDYFNGGWYALPDRWDAAMSLPLSGALDYSLPFCRTGGYRLFLSDKISFEKSIYHSIEHGPVNTTLANYTSVGYYYSDVPPPSATLPTLANTKVFQPDTLMLYPQLMNLGIDGEIAIKPAWAYPTGGQTFFCTVAQDASLRIPLGAIPLGDYHLYLDDVISPEGCSISVWQRQSQISDWLDRSNTAKKIEETTYVCDVHIDALINTITIRFRTRPNKNQFIFCRLILVRKDR